MGNILSVEDCHRTIVQNQPTSLVTNGYDRVAYLVFIVLHDDETQIFRKNAQLSKRSRRQTTGRGSLLAEEGLSDRFE